MVKIIFGRTFLSCSFGTASLLTCGLVVTLALVSDNHDKGWYVDTIIWEMNLELRLGEMIYCEHVTATSCLGRRTTSAFGISHG